MRHVLGNDDGKLNQSADDLLCIVLIPRRLVNQFFLAFLRNGVGIRVGFANQMADDGLRFLVVAIHEVFATRVAVHING